VYVFLKGEVFSNRSRADNKRINSNGYAVAKLPEDCGAQNVRNSK